jgi:hypothetical protein
MPGRSRAWLALLLSFVATAPAPPQTVRGTILGTVTDPSGAATPHARVTVREIATGLTRTEFANNEGEYSIPQLPAGRYDLEVEAPNFKKTERTGIELRVDERLRIDVPLAVGQVTEIVAVEAASSVVSTDSATVGNVVDNKKVTELPLNGRNFLQLNLLVPGANQGVKGSQNQTQGGSITINGAREQSNNFLLDGMDNNDLAINQYAVAISTEAILEFKVQASTYSAEFGRSPGAQINIATKSGGNQIHGVLYEYLRNSDLDAKNYFDRPGPIPEYRRNQYGGSIGGPIKRNKTFYFGNFEEARIRQGITKVATEPTSAMKSGDFSALPTIIYNPASLHTSNGTLVRDPFQRNRIPAGQISPVGQAALALYPTPNGPGTSPANGLYTSSPTKKDDFVQFTSRVDHHFDDNNTLFGRYSFSKEDRFDTFDSFSPAPITCRASAATHSTEGSRPWLTISGCSAPRRSMKPACRSPAYAVASFNRIWVTMSRARLASPAPGAARSISGCRSLRLSGTTAWAKPPTSRKIVTTTPMSLPILFPGLVDVTPRRRASKSGTSRRTSCSTRAPAAPSHSTRSTRRKCPLRPPVWSTQSPERATPLPTC